MALASSGSGQCGQGLGRGHPVGGGGGQTILFHLEPAVLVAVLDGRRLDLIDLVAEEVDLPGPLAGVAAQRLALLE